LNFVSNKKKKAPVNEKSYLTSYSIYLGLFIRLAFGKKNYINRPQEIWDYYTRLHCDDGNFTSKYADIVITMPAL